MQTRARRITGMLVKAATTVAVVSALTAIAAGPGTDAGLWHYRTGFAILRWAVYVAAAAGAVALIGSGLAAAARQYRMALLGLVAAGIAIAAIFPTGQLQGPASQVPRIHDITTDTDTPPQFVALLPLRQKT